MKNVKITNMNNMSTIIMTKEEFNKSKTILSEDSVYEETDEPVTIRYDLDNRTKLSKVLHDMWRRQQVYEINRAATI